MNIVVKVMLLAYILSGCTTTGGSFCNIAKPIRPSIEVIDTMSDKEVDAVLSHNLKGKKLCGWIQ